MSYEFTSSDFVSELQNNLGKNESDSTPKTEEAKEYSPKYPEIEVLGSSESRTTLLKKLSSNYVEVAEGHIE